MARTVPIDGDRQRLPAGLNARDDQGIRCPSCSCPTAVVVDSRVCVGGVRRVRRCDNCGSRFRTVERASLLVVAGRKPRVADLKADAEAAILDDALPGWTDLSPEDRAFVSRMVAAVSGRRPDAADDGG